MAYIDYIPANKADTNPKKDRLDYIPEISLDEKLVKKVTPKKAKHESKQKDETRKRDSKRNRN